MKDKAIDLSIVIPYYFDTSTLAEQLEALSQQRWSGSWEVIIADNGSGEALQAILTNFRPKLPNLRYVDAKAAPGAAYARNRGVEAAQGDKILFTDADDVVAPVWLAAMATALDEHPFIACRMDFETLNPPITMLGRNPHQQTDLQSYTYPNFLPHAAGTSLGVRRAVHDLVNGFDEKMIKLQDTDYCWRIQLQDIPLVFVPEATVYYRLRGGMGLLIKQAFRYGKYNVILYERYRDKGMPKLTWRRGLRRWYYIARTLPHIFEEERRSFWVWNVAFSWGRLVGSVSNRIIAL